MTISFGAGMTGVGRLLGPHRPASPVDYPCIYTNMGGYLFYPMSLQVLVLLNQYNTNMTKNQYV